MDKKADKEWLDNKMFFLLCIVLQGTVQYIYNINMWNKFARIFASKQVYQMISCRFGLQSSFQWELATPKMTAMAVAQKMGLTSDAALQPLSLQQKEQE